MHRSSVALMLRGKLSKLAEWEPVPTGLEVYIERMEGSEKERAKENMHTQREPVYPCKSEAQLFKEGIDRRQ